MSSPQAGVMERLSEQLDMGLSSSGCTAAPVQQSRGRWSHHDKA